MYIVLHVGMSEWQFYQDIQHNTPSGMAISLFDLLYWQHWQTLMPSRFKHIIKYNQQITKTLLFISVASYFLLQHCPQGSIKTQECHGIRIV